MYMYFFFKLLLYEFYHFKWFIIMVYAYVCKHKYTCYFAFICLHVFFLCAWNSLGVNIFT